MTLSYLSKLIMKFGYGIWIMEFRIDKIIVARNQKQGIEYA
jgi:hypothetical protein